MSKQPKLRRCKWLGVGPKERLSRKKSYRCLAPLPEPLDLPASVTESHNWRWPPIKTYVLLEYHCDRCPLYELKKGDA